MILIITIIRTIIILNITTLTPYVFCFLFDKPTNLFLSLYGLYMQYFCIYTNVKSKHFSFCLFSGKINNVANRLYSKILFLTHNSRVNYRVIFRSNSFHSSHTVQASLASGGSSLLFFRPLIDDFVIRHCYYFKILSVMQSVRNYFRTR